MAKPFKTFKESHARKEYICDGCGTKINIKEFYVREWGMSEAGELYNKRYCSQCAEKRPK